MRSTGSDRPAASDCAAWRIAVSRAGGSPVVSASFARTRAGGSAVPSCPRGLRDAPGLGHVGRAILECLDRQHVMSVEVVRLDVQDPWPSRSTSATRSSCMAS